MVEKFVINSIVKIALEGKKRISNEKQNCDPLIMSNHIHETQGTKMTN